MSKVQHLRALVNQRLILAAEEIFCLFERTIAEYEEEIERQRRQLKKNEINKTVLQQDVQRSIVSEDEQQRWSPSMEQLEPQSPHIKEEHDHLRNRQVGPQLQELEETELAAFPFIHTPVKNEITAEKAQSAQRRPIQTQEEASSSSKHRKWDHDREDCAEPEAEGNLDSGAHSQSAMGPEAEGCCEDWKEPLSCFETEAEDCDDYWKETMDPQSGSQTLSDAGCNSVRKLFSCPQCGKTFGSNQYLQRHVRCHAEAKTFLCSFCGKRFTKSSNLTTHLRVHTGEKPFTCSVCNTSFSLRCTLVTHMRIHTGEKPFICFLCGKRFTKKANLKVHMAVHTEEKAYSCGVCHRRFTWHSQAVLT
ncbi:uncharacterized protein LOC143000403 isoform X2 [Genypterus blacodes]|uniref:uncharacterized protein LOC143000403 isoform X2 n=1 Tax=Genypterus blacodes TaxID=154954 RepID=UPI003F76C2CF